MNDDDRKALSRLRRQEQLRFPKIRAATFRSAKEYRRKPKHPKG
jgi:hypothetical protein